MLAVVGLDPQDLSIIRRRRQRRKRGIASTETHAEKGNMLTSTSESSETKNLCLLCRCKRISHEKLDQKDTAWRIVLMFTERKTLQDVNQGIRNIFSGQLFGWTRNIALKIGPVLMRRQPESRM